MYYLKLIKNLRLLNFLFQAQAKSAEIYLRDLLIKKFTKVEKDVYKIDLENILYLNQVFEIFKNEFSTFLKSSPPPFSFLLLKGFSEVPISKILRIGKIYLEPTIRTEIDSFLKIKKIFYRIDPWGNLWELVLPSTVDPKLDLFYKDIFWSGDKDLCFFCKTLWHESFECPALLDFEPRKTFLSALNFQFKELSQLLWEEINNHFSFENLKYFYTRNFYLLPEFLRILFYKSEIIETWGHLKLDIEAPVRGGNLGLGLEYLMKKNLENANKEFLEVENDFRANIGLALISILRKDSKSALYHIETALSKVFTPFLKSYLLFLKGYFYEHIGEIVIAEEFYKEALEKDFSCLPAFYHYNLSKYQKGSSLSEIFVYFNHPFLLYWSYLEPIFIKEQKELEIILYDKIAEKREKASQRLKETEDRYHKIKIFFSEAEKKEYEEKLSKIRENVHKGGLGSIESAYQRALELDLEFQGYIYRQIKTIQKELERIKEEYRNFQFFWRRYPYKYEDVKFGGFLKDLSDLIQKIESKSRRKDPSDVLSVMFSEINSCKDMIKNLCIMKENMIKKWNFRMRLANFLKNFSVSEIFLASFYIIFPYLSLPKTFKSFFNLSSFLLISFVLLIICIVISHTKHYE